jgi:hypothetical protein
MLFGFDNAQRIVDVARIFLGWGGGGSQNFCLQELTFLFNIIFMNASLVILYAVQIVLCESMVYWFCLRIFL